MTDATARLDAIQAQMDAAEPGPWFLDSDGVSIYYVFHNGDTLDRDRLAESSGADAEFIAAAPENTRYLLELARKQQASLDAVKSLMADPEHYDSQGPSEGYVSVENLTEALEAKP